MFEALTQRLEAIFDRLRGAGRLSEETRSSSTQRGASTSTRSWSRS